MSNQLAKLKQAIGAGARATKYRFGFAIPSTVPTTSDLRNADVLAKATQFPGMTLGQIETFSQGRKLPIPGDTAYETTWTVTFYNTEDHGLRRDMIAWLRAADHFQNNMHSGNPGAIMGELYVAQLDSAEKETSRYTFHNVWVTDVAGVEVGDEQLDTIQEFDVTFSFSDWVVGDGELNHPESGNAATGNPVAY